MARVEGVSFERTIYIYIYTVMHNNISRIYFIMALSKEKFIRALLILLLQNMICWELIDTSAANDGFKKITVIPNELSCEQLIKRTLLLNSDICSRENDTNSSKEGNNNNNSNELNNKFRTRFYEIKSPYRDFYILLNEFNHEFLAPNFQIDERFGDLYQQTTTDEEERHCFYKGRVITDVSSSVTLNICGGLQGRIGTTTGDFFITPIKVSISDAVEHILYIPDEKLTSARKHSSSCGSTDVYNDQPQKIIHNFEFTFGNSGDIQLVPVTSRQRRALSVRRYIETMIVADESMYIHYGKKEVELRRYLLSIMAIVTNIMKDSSIGNSLDVSVIKLVILKKNPPSLKVTSNAARSLKRFCKWQKRENKPNDDDPEHHDAAILLTHKDLCSSSGKCDTLGLADLGSVCDPIRSCAIVEDNGLSVAFTIAHELGHLLNAPHDGNSKHCTDSNIHIMTPTFSINAKTWTWSKCSRKHITNFLESSQARCLLDKPSPKFEHPLPRKLPGQMFSRNEQCQLIFGKKSYVCPFMRCDQISCVHVTRGRKSCQTNSMPWQDGTPCSTNSWCIKGICEKKKKMNPVHGNWGSWGQFSKCSRPCGGGIKVATRECNNPKPKYGGNYCIGQRHDYKSCNTMKCLDEKMSFRAKQCRAFNGKDLGIQGIHANTKWVPRYGEIAKEDHCKLFCHVKGYGIYYQLASKVIDGTKCEKGSNDICVDGECKPAGCDNILGSKAKLDSCGVCNGDNSTCRTYAGYKNSTSAGYNFVVHVPRGASQLKVVQISDSGKHDSVFLALLDNRRKNIFNGNWIVSLGRGRYQSYGTTVFYSGPNEVKETIDVPGFLKTPLEIHALSIVPSNSSNIRYSYKYPIRGKQKYKWMLSKKWSSCFPVCQGFQIREYECHREIDSQIVSHTKCSGRRPQGKHRVCNQHCTLTWKVSKEDCIPINACGNGVQDQTVVCVKHSKTGTVKHLSHHECHKAKIGKMPPREIPCFSPCTRVRWVYTSWSKCNQSCDGGTQNRTALCIDQKTNSTLKDKKCEHTDKAILVKSCNTHTCPKWHTGAWTGVCSVTCGQGYVERLVYCVVAGKRVSDTKCKEVKKPYQTRPCLMSPCATWKTRAWSRCSKSCGGGHQIREVYCETGAGENVPDDECNMKEKPDNRRKCFEKACQLNVKLVFENPKETNVLTHVRWMTGAWGECSKSCGKGFRERVVECMSNNVIVKESKCSASRKPVTKEFCNVFSCPFWRHGAWSKCTKPCGGGTQTRLVLCGYNGTIVTDEWCESEGKPKERRYCNLIDCKPAGDSPVMVISPVSTSWRAGEWSKCSTSCGVGVKKRRVRCISEEKDCPVVFKPKEIITCNSGTCPGWNYGQWTPCYADKECGKGWQARLVVCQMDNGSILPNNACHFRYKPVNNKTCELEPCKRNAVWSTTPWQPCNVPCGVGEQFRYISCEDRKQKRLPDSDCLAYEKRPVQRKTCRRSLCPIWVAGDWDECDTLCYHRRTARCMRGQEYLSDNQCKVDLKPIEEKECSNENCVRLPTFKWKPGQWSPCSSTCGYSLRSRRLVCINERELAVHESHCTEKKPKHIEQCFEGPCPPKWVSRPWSECSVTCGNGIQSRDVDCEDPTGLKTKDEACRSIARPSRTRPCSRGHCGDKYRWVASSWTECSRSCGVGEMRRGVLCYNSHNVTQHHSKCVSDDMPPNMKVCNTYNCPFASCRDIKVDLNVKFDGEQTLHVGNQSLLVYCEGMHRHNPKEYITLKTDPKENFAEIYGKRLTDSKQCPNGGERQIPCKDCVDYTASGVTFFKKVRFDVKRVAIVPEDKTFADQFGRNPPGFATAGDCYSGAQCPQGRFMVNLEGTGLRVAGNVKWTSRGYHTSQKIRRFKDGQVIEGKCGGYCGVCSPDYYDGLKVEIISR